MSHIRNHVSTITFNIPPNLAKPNKQEYIIKVFL